MSLHVGMYCTECPGLTCYASATAREGYIREGRPSLRRDLPCLLYNDRVPEWKGCL